jgi:hypothetical protein
MARRTNWKKDHSAKEFQYFFSKNQKFCQFLVFSTLTMNKPNLLNIFTIILLSEQHKNQLISNLPHAAIIAIHLDLPFSKIGG